MNTIVNSTGFLQNESAVCGIPLQKQDGLMQGFAPRVTAFGIDSALRIFNNKTVSSGFTTSNGSWASLYGSVGIDSLGANRLLIGQFTTDGIFSFELNIQIGTPAGGVENYVAKNATGIEKLLSDLIYNSSVSQIETQTKEKKRKKK